MRLLDKAWTALKIVGAARELAIDTRRFSWDAAAGTTFFLQAEYADIRFETHEGPEILAKLELQAGFGWQLVTDQDEAGVYIIARRKALVGGIGRGKFAFTVPPHVHISLRLSHCQVCFDKVITTLDLPPSSSTL